MKKARINEKIYHSLKERKRKKQVTKARKLSIASFVSFILSFLLLFNPFLFSFE
jgi:hypothetical protein